ncbi:lipid-binding SYLF domain-containing protein [Campylobacter sp. faydin G-140]|uniref:lipid-binding SYLF domain-containing protein n=1 Tax=Campylobacter anatolicus TaxID=2829105 RepID=UPI001B9D7471|nr:lipid-binding SYLF domain-containing protein [Campylobacter anatolicus]MBR8466421.1 lipid-binding SYLF domain-containing protein [Campylobacter anatolicus]
MKKFIIWLCLTVVSFASEELVLSSANSFVTTMRVNSKAPIKDLLQSSKAIIVFPSVKKVGFVVGGMGGDGVMIVGDMSSPSEIVSVSISGGSLGLQLGYEDSSLVLFVLKDSLVNDIKNSKLTINANASFVFGNIGRRADKISDFKFSSDIYAYATNDGFFAGASFGGAVISVKDESLKQSGYAYEQLINATSKF